MSCAAVGSRRIWWSGLAAAWLSVVGISSADGQQVPVAPGALGNDARPPSPVSYVRDVQGRVVGWTDQHGMAAEFEYTADGKIAGVKTNGGFSARQIFDAQGRLSEVIGPSGGRFAFTRDAQGRIVSIADPLGRKTQFTFDADGHMSKITDSAGKSITYAQAGANQFERRAADGSRITRQYDSAGRLIAADNGQFSIRRTFDAAGRLISVDYPSIRKTVRYTYDARGRRTGMIDPDGGETRYEYGPSRLSAIVAPDGSRFRFKWDANGRLLAVGYPNGVIGRWTYDAAGHVTAIGYYGADQSYVAGTSYRYDKKENLAAERDTAGVVTRFTYDSAGQLTREDGLNGMTAYAYGAGGNRTSMSRGSSSVSYTYDAADQLTAAGSTRYAYDTNGRLTERRTPQGIDKFEYDVWGHLTHVATGRGADVRFDYGPTGTRISRSDGRQKSTFVYDGLALLAELGPDLKTKARYIHAPGLDRPLAVIRDGKAYFYHFNRQGSIIALTDSAGKLAGSFSYDAFGRTLSGGAAATNLFAFTGREWDAALGLYYFRARYYDPETGRFLSRDPAAGSIVNPIALNRYLYANNSPGRYRDPLGLSNDSVDDWDPWDPNPENPIYDADRAEAENLLDAHDYLRDTIEWASHPENYKPGDPNWEHVAKDPKEFNIADLKQSLKDVEDDLAERGLAPRQQRVGSGKSASVDTPTQPGTPNDDWDPLDPNPENPIFDPELYEQDSLIDAYNYTRDQLKSAANDPNVDVDALKTQLGEIEQGLSEYGLKPPPERVAGTSGPNSAGADTDTVVPKKPFSSTDELGDVPTRNSPQTSDVDAQANVDTVRGNPIDPQTNVDTLPGTQPAGPEPAPPSTPSASANPNSGGGFLTPEKIAEAKSGAKGGAAAGGIMGFAACLYAKQTPEFANLTVGDCLAQAGIGALTGATVGALGALAPAVIPILAAAGAAEGIKNIGELISEWEKDKQAGKDEATALNNAGDLVSQNAFNDMLKRCDYKAALKLANYLFDHPPPPTWINTVMPNTVRGAAAQDQVEQALLQLKGTSDPAKRQQLIAGARQSAKDTPCLTKQIDAVAPPSSPPPSPSQASICPPPPSKPVPCKAGVDPVTGAPLGVGACGRAAIGMSPQLAAKLQADSEKAQAAKYDAAMAAWRASCHANQLFEDVFTPPVPKTRLASLVSTPPGEGALDSPRPPVSTPPGEGALDSPNHPAQPAKSPSTPGPQASLPTPQPPGPSFAPSPGPAPSTPGPGINSGMPPVHPQNPPAPPPVHPATPATPTPQTNKPIIDTFTPPKTTPQTNKPIIDTFTPPNKGSASVYGQSCSDPVNGTRTCTDSLGAKCTTTGAAGCDPRTGKDYPVTPSPAPPNNPPAANTAKQPQPPGPANTPPAPPPGKKTAALPVQPLPNASPPNVLPPPKSTTPPKVAALPVQPLAPLNPTTPPKPEPKVAALPAQPVPGAGPVKPEPKAAAQTPAPTPPPAKPPEPAPAAAAAKPPPPAPAPVASKPAPGTPPAPSLPQQVAKVQPPPVKAECRKEPYDFVLDHNSTLNIPMAVVGGAACEHKYFSKGETAYINNTSITGQPSGGKLNKLDLLNYRYQPNFGFVGSDQYSIRVCGGNSNGKGCVDITYSVDVQ